MTNTAVVPTANVEGNIGSCSVQTSRVWVNSITAREFATNSCTGEIVSDHTFIDWGFVYFPGVIVVIIIAVLLGMKKLMD